MLMAVAAAERGETDTLAVVPLVEAVLPRLLWLVLAAGVMAVMLEALAELAVLAT